MKVLHIINNLGAGGAEKLLEDLIPLMNKGKDVKADILLLTDKNNVFYNSLIKKGIKVDFIKYKNMYDPRNVLEIKKYIHKGNYNIVHSHLFPAQYWVALTKVIYRNKKVKFITTEHNTTNRRREKFYFRPIDKFIYSQYDVIISISEKTKDNLINWIDPKRKRVDKHIVIENGVDLEKFENAIKKDLNKYTNNDDKNIKYITMVSRFTPQKDHETLLKALDKLPLNVHLVLVGEGPLKEKYITLSQEMKIQNRVHFLGFRKDVASIMKSSDIIVQSSNWEGFGLTAVEAMATGTPLLATDVPGLREVVFNGGLLFEKKKYRGSYKQNKFIVK